jgi:hypothetical protein
MAFRHGPDKPANSRMINRVTVMCSCLWRQQWSYGTNLQFRQLAIQDTSREEEQNVYCTSIT